MRGCNVDLVETWKGAGWIPGRHCTYVRQGNPLECCPRSSNMSGRVALHHPWRRVVSICVSLSDSCCFIRAAPLFLTAIADKELVCMPHSSHIPYHIAVATEGINRAKEVPPPHPPHSGRVLGGKPFVQLTGWWTRVTKPWAEMLG